MSPVIGRSLRPMLRLYIVAAVISLVIVTAAGCGSTATTSTSDTAPSTTASTQPGPESTSQPPDSTGQLPDSTLPSSAARSSDLADAGFFDMSLIHEITASFSQEDYDAMVQTYRETGEKDWIEATVTIDGETYERVGVRLKGNSSVMGLKQARAKGPGADASADTPEGLPWLIDLDKYVDGQNHEGIIELVVRSNTSQTALNEAVALDLLREAGLASQEAVYVSFSINDSEPVLRLVIENPDDVWMADNFDVSGALYKAESTGDYSYRGDDPDSYDEVFDQEAGKTNADLTPLMEFLDFINNADDATFNAELPDRLDIDAFATYLAMQELINNFDDIDGPGNNSYLYYDTKTSQFTVVPWDHNLAFGGMGAGKGGGMGFDASLPEGTEMPEGMQPPAGAQGRPGAQGGPDTQIPAAGQGQGAGQGQTAGQGQGQAAGQGQFRGNGGVGHAKSNILVNRFKANPEWEQLYEDRLAELRTELYDSGRAAEILAQWAAVLKSEASDLVDAATVDKEAANISKYFTVK